MPQITHVYETCISAQDLTAMERFYTSVLGFRKVSDNSPRGITLRVNPEGVLLIFNPGLTRQPHPEVPSHGAIGAGHVAFSCAADELESWKPYLISNGIPIEREIEWGDRARSIYFRDPAGNSIEIKAGEIWPP
jgi:catechol-2,3-dioxygenase